MKFVRWGLPGLERPGLLDRAGHIRDLSVVAAEVSYSDLVAATLKGVVAEDLPLVQDGVRLGPCVGEVHNFIAIGLNYADHAAEVRLPHPTEPVLFSKATTSIAGATDNIVLPVGSTRVDWEVELGIVIGSPAYKVPRSEVPEVVAGYCVCNDISEREWQLERGGQWIKGKSFPGFAPLGPWLVTPDEVPDVQDLRLWLNINGEQRQSGTTHSMIFDVAEIVSYVSRFMRLLPGDVITTGTPAGVGMSMVPPTYLKRGDVVTCGIDGLGSQRQRVVAEEDGNRQLQDRQV